ncbi:NEW3 domain-containing protein [Rathayibacter sp. CAU 1779]
MTPAPASSGETASPTATASPDSKTAKAVKKGGATTTNASYNGLALTPPMGWNDWSYYQCNIDESLILQQAKALVTTGLAKVGYDTVTIDDCWMQKQRDADGNLQADTTLFPDGMKYVADKVHALGLKFGIYEDAGTSTCGGYAGSWGHFTQDADLFASWGVDYVKLDGCNVPSVAGQTDAQTYDQAYAEFSKALIATGRPIVFSASAPAYFQGTSDWQSVIAATSTISNLWREGADTALGQESAASKWNAITYNYGYNVGLGQYAGPGHWNDPDFLLAGDSGLSNAEMQSQVALWAEMASPLISSTNLTKLSPAALKILSNKNIIAVDQDRLGTQGSIVQSGTNYDVLAKPLSNGDVSVVLFNSGSSAQTITTTAANIGLAGASPLKLTDLVTGAATSTLGTISADVAAHGTVMYRVHVGDTDHAAPAVALTVKSGTLSAGDSGTVTVIATNYSGQGISGGTIALSTPSGWKISPASRGFGSIPVGGSTTARFTVKVSAPQPGPQDTVVTATATYRWGWSSRASVSGGFDVLTNAPYPNLASAFNNVGVTSQTATTNGNFDGSGDSYSAEQLAAAGVTPGSTVTAAGATFTWPSAAVGTNDNVQAAGQLVLQSGSGSRLAFLGAEAGFTSGTVTVDYTDGTTSTGTLGFPNWLFSAANPPTDYGSTLAITTNGRSTPSGYANANYQYGVFVNSIPLTAGKTVQSVQLPSTSAIHIFAMSVQ